jgi:photosystem II stability/assembly factor-like uncharacterized protein
MAGSAIRRLMMAAMGTVLLGAISTPASAADPAKPQIDPALFKALHWRGIGPYRGGRALAVTGVPGEPELFYFGAVAGGVWKTRDAGATWAPIFDHEGMSSIGAIAVAPSDHNVLYVGTGEGALRGNITYGDGVYKSTDAGRTWRNIGLKDSRQIGALIVDPHNPEIVLVAAIGHAFGPNPERGVYRTADGGKSWTKVLGKDDQTGAIDVTFDPHNANIVYAALWQVQRQPWNLSSGGPGSGLYRSTDGGVSWTELKGNGLPDGILGRIDIAVSGADSNRVFAMIEAKEGGLFRSDDAGEHWQRVNADGRLRQRAWYFSKIWADPKSANTIYALNTGMLRSIDGGRNFELVSATHGDHHGLWIDPDHPERLINANDGGASVSVDAGKTWTTQDNQPTAQFYHVAVDNRWPYYVYGAQQDNSTIAIASYDDNGVIGRADWYAVGGGESGFIVPDPRDGNIVYADAENFISRFDKRTEQAQDISVWPVDNSGHPAAELEHRFNWTTPLALSPHDPDTLYAGAEMVFKTTDHGLSWVPISGDLTRNDRSKQQASGGPLTKDITSVEYYDTIFALAESPLQKGMIWAGTDDGLVQLTSDGGAHWSAVTPSGMPEWSTISMIEPGHFDAGGGYLAVDRHRLDDIKPYAYKTANGGKSWTSITTGLPDGAVVHAVREDPVKRGLLYAGTERGVFVSFDDGGHWQSLQLDLPPSPIHDLVVKNDDLVVATHGRSFWILTDVTPLRQLDPAAPAPDLELYAPQTALRLHYPDQVDSRHPVGQNPPSGALIDYAFKAAPGDEVTLDILDTAGKQVRHMSSKDSGKEKQPPEWPDQIEPPDTIPAEAGMNRFVWDLRYDDPVQIPGAFYSGLAPRGPLVPPGQYQVKLALKGESRTAPMTVVADPRVPGADAAIQAKSALALAAYHDIDVLHRAVNEIRQVKSEIARLHKSFDADAAGRKLLDEGDALVTAAVPIEEALMQVNMKGSEANLAFPGMLNEQLASFLSLFDDADTPPTKAQTAIFDALHRQLTTQLDKWAAVKQTALPAFNESVRQSGVPALYIGRPG